MRKCKRGHGDHFGARCPTCDAILDLGIKIGKHWRDQDGVNGALLDELAQLTRGAEALPFVRVVALELAERARIRDAIETMAEGLAEYDQLDRVILAKLRRDD